MKKICKLFISIIMIVLVTTACGKKYTIEDYIGQKFSGKDLWGNSLVVTIRAFNDDKLTWTYTDTYGEGEKSFIIHEELNTKYKDEKTSFNLSGKADYAEYLYDYSGTLSLKDGKVVIKYESGQIISSNLQGGSSSYNVGSLEDNRIITLEKVIDNS